MADVIERSGIAQHFRELITNMNTKGKTRDKNANVGLKSGLKTQAKAELKIDLNGGILNGGILNEKIFADIIGQESAKSHLLGALATGHHAIIIGPPGIGKTTLAKNVAKLLPEMTTTGCEYNCAAENPVCPACKTAEKKKQIKVKGIGRFVRIQGSPDLSTEDIFGDIDPIKALKFGPSSIEAFTPGKIFRANNGVLFFDEINRCPEKLQNSLLQALEEGKITLGGYTVEFPANFVLIGTMNPEDSSTEPLSDVFLDRFDAVYMTYPETAELESKIVMEKGLSVADFPSELLGFMIGFVRHIRDNKNVLKKPSVRAQISLYERAQANAIASGRKSVKFDDISEAVQSVLAHRIELVPSMKFVRPVENFIREEFSDYSSRYSDLKSRLGDYG